jgi:hypothetical protein
MRRTSRRDGDQAGGRRRSHAVGPSVPTRPSARWHLALVAVAASTAVAVPGAPADIGLSDLPPAGAEPSAVAVDGAVAGSPPAGAVDPAVPVGGAVAVDGLLAAVERAAGGTFVVRSRFERRLAGGGRLTADVVLAQRPPDRLVRQAGTVSGRVGGRLVACTRFDGRAVPCADAGPARPWPDDVAAEVAAVGRLVAGPSSRYAVTMAGAGGCFDLRLRVWEPAAPYGTAARLCFDPATGAPTRTEVTRPEGRDVTVAVAVEDPVDADFAVPG